MHKRTLSLFLGLCLLLSLLPAAALAANLPEAAGGTALVSSHTVTVNGTKLPSQLYLLRSGEGDTTYIKVRDLANALNGTKAQFSVSLTDDGAINLLRGQPYVPNGSENEVPFTGDQTYANNTRSVYVDDELTEIPAFTLGGGGYTYYQLNEMASIFGYEASWSRETDIVITAGPAGAAEAQPKEAATAEDFLAALDDPAVSEIIVPEGAFGGMTIEQDVTLDKPLTVYGGQTEKGNVGSLAFAGKLTNNSTLTVKGPSFVLTLSDFTNNGELKVDGGRFACHFKEVGGTGNNCKALNTGTILVSAYFETRVPFENQGTISCIANAFTYEDFLNSGSVVVGSADKHPDSEDDLVWLSLYAPMTNDGDILLRGNARLYFGDPANVSWKGVGVKCEDKACTEAIANSQYPIYHISAPAN